MVYTLKKIFLLLIIITILVGGAYFYYSRSKKTTSNQLTEEKNWGNISGWFKNQPNLVSEWKNHNFTYEQAKDWINAGLKPNDILFAQWLRDNENFTPESTLNYGNETNLRKSYQVYQKQKVTLKDKILAGCWEWLLTDFPLGEENKDSLGVKKTMKKIALEKTIEDLKNNSLSENDKLSTFQNLMNNYQQVDKESELFLTENYQNLQEWAEEWEESLVSWFEDRKRITPAEIDWATSRINHNLSVKILPANWFSSIIRQMESNQKSLDISPILGEIQTDDELVFIPVKNPNNGRWSLLVFEKGNNLFYHHDSPDNELEQKNLNCLSPILEKIVNAMNRIKRQTGNISENLWELYIRKRHIDSKTTDSGIMVITLIQRIISLYSNRFRLVAEKGEMNGEKYTRNKQYLKEVANNLGEFDFSEERKIWQERYLAENNN